ncbi:MAG: ATP-binding protein [Allorhizobium sp.]
MKSIRLRLFTILLVTTSAVWLFATIWIYASTQAEVERVLDARLTEAARMVSSLIADHRIDAASAADAAASQSPSDSFEAAKGSYNRQLSCQIWSLQGDLLGRSESAPASSLAAHSDGFEETVINGERWRVYAIVNPTLGVRVLVGDSIEIRERLIGDVVKGLLLPAVVILPLLAVLIWLSLGRGLAPLNQIAASLSGRAATELHPVDDTAAPLEIKPIIMSLNSLFQRVGEARERERNFTAYAAHELKTPLAGLKTQAQIAIRSEDAAVQRQALARIATSVDRTSRMVRQLIDMAAVDSTDVAMEPEEVDVALLIGDIASELEGVTASKDVRVVTLADAPDRACSVRTDRTLLRLALRNILENAVQHSPEGGEVTCRVAASENGATIEISDQGPGIEPAEHERVKEKFYRNSRAGSIGSGLGLSIVQMALERIGGSIAFSRGVDGFAVRTWIPSLQ